MARPMSGASSNRYGTYTTRRDVILHEARRKARRVETLGTGGAGVLAMR